MDPEDQVPHHYQLYCLIHYLQGDQLKMAVCFCYLEKTLLAQCTRTVAYTEQVTFYKVPEIHDHV